MSDIVLAIDFDGTLVDHIYPSIGHRVPGAFPWLKKFQAAGAKLILWTMRYGNTLQDAVEFCRAEGIEFWGVNVNPGQHTWTGSKKAYAHCYIDDAGFNCPLRENPRCGGRPFVDWSVVGPAVMKMLEEHANAGKV